MIAVGLMTEGGFAGNLRYVALPAALLCVLAGVGWVELVRAVARRAPAAPRLGAGRRLVAAAAPFVIADLDELRDGADADSRRRPTSTTTLPAAIAKAGGREAVMRCGPVFTGPFQVPAVAWHLHLHQRRGRHRPQAAGRRDRAARLGARGRSALPAAVTVTTRWVVRRACDA